MEAVTVSSSQLRVPEKAREALAHDQVVEVRRRHQPRPAFVLISPSAYEASRPVLDRIQRGLPAPVEGLLDDEDFEVLSHQRQLDEELDQGVLESWI